MFGGAQFLSTKNNVKAQRFWAWPIPQQRPELVDVGAIPFKLEAAISASAAEPPVWVKPVAGPTDMGFSEFAPYPVV